MRYYNDIMREIRESRFLTQREIAKVLGINQRVYSRYELGLTALPIKHLITLCQFYNVSADYILGLK